MRDRLPVLAVALLLTPTLDAFNVEQFFTQHARRVVEISTNRINLDFLPFFVFGYEQTSKHPLTLIAEFHAGNETSTFYNCTLKFNSTQFSYEHYGKVSSVLSGVMFAAKKDYSDVLRLTRTDEGFDVFWNASRDVNQGAKEKLFMIDERTMVLPQLTRYGINLRSHGNLSISKMFPVRKRSGELVFIRYANKLPFQYYLQLTWTRKCGIYWPIFYDWLVILLPRFRLYDLPLPPRRCKATLSVQSKDTHRLFYKRAMIHFSVLAKSINLQMDADEDTKIVRIRHQNYERIYYSLETLYEEEWFTFWKWPGKRGLERLKRAWRSFEKEFKTLFEIPFTQRFMYQNEESRYFVGLERAIKSAVYFDMVIQSTLECPEDGCRHEDWISGERFTCAGVAKALGFESELLAERMGVESFQDFLRMECDRFNTVFYDLLRRVSLHVSQLRADADSLLSIDNGIYIDNWANEVVRKIYY